MLLSVLAPIVTLDMVSCAQDVRKRTFEIRDDSAHAFWKVATSL